MATWDLPTGSFLRDYTLPPIGESRARKLKHIAINTAYVAVLCEADSSEGIGQALFVMSRETGEQQARFNGCYTKTALALYGYVLGSRPSWCTVWRNATLS